MASTANRLVPRLGTDPGTLPEEQTAQARLRAAVYNGVSERDAKEIVAALVEKAKAGDRVALKFFFEHILGGRPTSAVQNNYYAIAEADPSPEEIVARAEELRAKTLAARRNGRG